jgi:hypothetical protein
MPILRFTNPSDLPAYEGWNFKVLPAEICLKAEDMRDIFTKYLERHRKIYSGHAKELPVYAEAERIGQHHQKLVAACANGTDIVLDDYVWAFCSELMFERRFVSVFCPACNTLCTPDVCIVIEWTFGEDLSAEGGRRVTCPAGHTLYACMEWNS